MKNFDSFYTELISDQRWFELLRHYKDETIRKAAEKVWAQLVADKIEDVRPMSENRKHLYNLIIKNPGDKVVLKNWAAKALEIQEAEKKEEWIPLTGEARAKKLAEYKAIIDSLPMINNFPRVTEVEKAGQVLPPKPEPYPVTTPEEAYIRDRHFEWIKTCFEPRTGEKNLNYVSEEDYNIWYDCEFLTKQNK